MNEHLACIYEVNLPSTPASIIEVENLIEKACAELHLSEELFGNILISVTEGVNNAILHGNKSQPVLSVHMEILNNEDWICFRIQDQGEGFNPDLIPDPTAPENLLKESGRGVFLMRSLADEVTFENNATVVNIYFRR